MATHQPINHKSQQHSGKVEDQQKLEHNRINVGTPKVPPTKTGSGAPDAGRGGRSPMPPDNGKLSQKRGS